MLRGASELVHASVLLNEPGLVPTPPSQVHDNEAAKPGKCEPPASQGEGAPHCGRVSRPNPSIQDSRLPMAAHELTSCSPELQPPRLDQVASDLVHVKTVRFIRLEGPGSQGYPVGAMRTQPRPCRPPRFTQASSPLLLPSGGCDAPVALGSFSC
jgi:hypothetical protein